MNKIDDTISECIDKRIFESEPNDGIMTSNKPIVLWLRYMSYFERTAKIMKKQYIQSLQKKQPITQEQFDSLNDRIHSDLDEMATYL